MDGKILGVVSAKGGVGKTTIIITLADILKSVFEKRVLVVDGNLEVPSIGLFLDLLHPPVTLQDVLEGKISIQQAVYAHRRGFDIVPGYLMAQKKTSTTNLREKIRPLIDRYDMIIIDSEPGINEDVLGVMKASDQLLVVTTPEYIAVATTFKVVKTAKEMNIPILGVVVNKMRGKKYEMSQKEIESSLALPVISTVPYDSKVSEAFSRASSALSLFPSSSAVKNLKKLAAEIAGEEYPERVSLLSWRILRRKAPREAAIEASGESKDLSAQEKERVEEIKKLALPKKKILEAALEKLKKNYEEGFIGEDMYNELKNKYEKEIKEIESKIEGD
jgi:MinD-like ATPase involved in chromosome partitioning or flagellar assembly